MTRLEAVPTADLRTALEAVEGSRPATRLIAAIAYKHGVSQRELATWFDVERKTVYNWFRRFEARPDALAAAARDDPRTGRPPKLTEAQRARLSTTLARPPTAAGYDAPEWTPPLLCEHVREAYDVEYTVASGRRLLSALG